MNAHAHDPTAPRHPQVTASERRSRLKDAPAVLDEEKHGVDRDEIYRGKKVKGHRLHTPSPTADPDPDP